MKTILFRGAHQNCEGITRRDFVKVGGLGIFGLALPQFLQMRAAVAAAGGTSPKADACILLWLSGGPSHVDTFDPKPDAPAEFRGEFKAIETNVPGIQISEHLPLTAKQMDKIALVRTLTSNIAAHQQATQYLLTGYRPLPTLEYPVYGSVVSKELGPRAAMPPFVSIPGATRGTGAGFIGNAYNPFPVADPSRPNFRVSNITLPENVDRDRLLRRRGFIDKMNGRFTDVRPDSHVKAVDTFYEQAYDLVTSQKAQEAFDLSKESATTRELYGQTTLGQGALLARRMVEAGTRFVTVTRGNWDTHQQNFQRLSNQLLPDLDRAYAALLQDLAERGMLEKTLVLVMGEFGRTPRVNARGGRDHWSRNRFVTFAGGGVRGGQVIGKSDATGADPAERPVTVEEVSRTLYSQLGVNTDTIYQTPTGRPIRVATEDSKVIKELFG